MKLTRFPFFVGVTMDDSAVVNQHISIRWLHEAPYMMPQLAAYDDTLSFVRYHHPAR